MKPRLQDKSTRPEVVLGALLLLLGTIGCRGTGGDGAATPAASPSTATTKPAAAPSRGQSRYLVVFDKGDSAQVMGEVTFNFADGGFKPDLWKPGGLYLFRATNGLSARGIAEIVPGFSPKPGEVYEVGEGRTLKKFSDVDLGKSNEDIAREFGISVR